MRWLLGVLLILGSVPSAGAQGNGRTLQFSLDRSGPPSVQYTIAVAQEGVGVYDPHLATGQIQVGEPSGEQKAIRVGPALIKRLFAAVPMIEGGRCETHSKSIARTGVKTLRYAATERQAQCTYNYSDDDRVNDATEAFEAIAETLLYGERLAGKLRFDRLGLDAELDGLQSAVTDGRALEVGNISRVLQAISEDERVMDRVRRKATRLLQSATPGQTAVDAGSNPR